jgi:VWFA-related protein
MKRILFAAAALAAFAQQPTVVFRTTANLVVLDVTVRDRAGAEIPNLEKTDFTVLEDGKPQELAIFEFQRLESQPLPPLAPQFAKEDPRPAPAAAAAMIASAAPGKVQYQDKRLMVMFFDLSSMQPPEQLRARNAALDFVANRMTSADVISIMTFGTNLEVRQDFTADRDRLAEVIRGFRIGEDAELAAEGDTADEESGEDTGAAFLADESEFNIFNTDRKLAALESAAKMLAALPEKKALVYFSSGVGRTGVENESQLRSTVNAAVRANVSFYPVDARGLMAMVPGGDAGQASARGSGIFTGQQQRRQQSRFQQQQETLVTLASDTGGKALMDTNDLAMGFTQAQQDIRSYYILGYYSANAAQDGRYRRVQVRLASNPQARLNYRGGYFGPKHFGRFTESDKEQHLQEALMLGDPITDLPLALEVNYFRIGRDRYFIPVAVKIPGSEVELARRRGAESTEFDFIGQVRDARGRLTASVRDGIRVNLDEAGAAQLGQRSFQYDTGFTLAPGTYRLKFLARENLTGKMGTFETSFEVPDLMAQSDRLRASSVVWASQREPVAAAVGSAERRKRLLAANPLVADGHKLAPSITRVFRNDQNLYVFLEVYDPAPGPVDGAPSVTASLAFYRGRVKAFESEPVKVTSMAGARPGAVAVRFQAPLGKLRPGRYTCQVSVVDEVGRRFAFVRAPVVLLEGNTAP